MTEVLWPYAVPRVVNRGLGTAIAGIGCLVFALVLAVAFPGSGLGVGLAFTLGLVGLVLAVGGGFVLEQDAGR